MSLGMYALKPVFDLDAVVEHPTCVYRLPVIQSSMPIEGVGACSGVGAGAVAGGAVAALAARQEAILGRLEQLKEEVAAYQASLGLPTAPAAPAAQVTGAIVRFGNTRVGLGSLLSGPTVLSLPLHPPLTPPSAPSNLALPALGNHLCELPHGDLPHGAAEGHHGGPGEAVCGAS